jgi:hypothetical protein
MLCNRSIASAKSHVANLAFAKVFENPVTPVAVRIPMFESLFACDDNYHRVLRRCYDPSLLLAAKARVNVDPSIVNAANLKTPGHFAGSLFCAIVRLGPQCIRAAGSSRMPPSVANAAIAASRVGSWPYIGVPSSWQSNISVHIHDVPTATAAAFMMRPTRRRGRCGLIALI